MGHRRDLGLFEFCTCAHTGTEKVGKVDKVWQITLEQPCQEVCHVYCVGYGEICQGAKVARG